jgi:hypothetical protein
MTAENFAYWLQGFFELIAVGEKTPGKLVLTPEQTEMVERHLKLVFQEMALVRREPVTISHSGIELGDLLSSRARIC